MKNGQDALAILITMPHSHYSEKARWALDRLALPYREEPHVPLLHRFATRRNGGGSVPVLVHGSKRLVDSSAIVAHADAWCGGDGLYPRDPELRREVEALEERFDEQLGPHTRRWAYAQLLAQPRLLVPLVSRGVPRLEAMLLPLVMPFFRYMVRSRLRITPESAQRSLERVKGMFCDVDLMLADGRRFLVGQRFSAADLTFAALAAPVLFPAGYGGAYPAFEEVPETMRAEVSSLRDTNAGRFAMGLFLHERSGP